MRAFHLLFALLLLAISGFSQTYKGAYITYKPTGTAGNNEYEITLTTYIDSDKGAASFRDRENIQFGDGQEELVVSILNKIPIGKNTWKNVYTTSHVFPDGGCYNIGWSASDANYKNTKGQYGFFVQSQLCINSNLGVPPVNHSPTMKGELNFEGRTDSVYSTGLSISDTIEKGDSLFTEIIEGDERDYFSPTKVSPFQNNMYLKNGELVWNKSNEPGLYLLWLRNYEYRTISTQSGSNSQRIGYIDVLWTVEVEGPVAVEETKTALEMKVTYFNDKVCITSTLAQRPYSIYTIAGSKVLQGQLLDGKAVISSAYLQPGCYIVHVEGEEKILSEKIIIQ